MKFIKLLLIAYFTIRFTLNFGFCQSIGSKQWGYKTSGDVRSSPAIASDGITYISPKYNYLYAINPDGSRKWRFKTGDDVSSSPAIGSDVTIYVGSGDNYLYAINSDGSIPFTRSTFPSF